jgi:hypothetical protein
MTCQAHPAQAFTASPTEHVRRDEDHTTGGHPTSQPGAHARRSGPSSRRYLVGVAVPVTVTVRAQDGRHAQHDATHIISGDLRRLRHAHAHGGDHDPIRIGQARPRHYQPGWHHRPTYQIRAQIRVAITVNAADRDAAWTAARDLLITDLRRLRRVHLTVPGIRAEWITDLHPHDRS